MNFVVEVLEYGQNWVFIALFAHGHFHAVEGAPQGWPHSKEIHTLQCALLQCALYNSKFSTNYIKIRHVNILCMFSTITSNCIRYKFNALKLTKFKLKRQINFVYKNSASHIHVLLSITCATKPDWKIIADSKCFQV